MDRPLSAEPTRRPDATVDRGPVTPDATTAPAGASASKSSLAAVVLGLQRAAGNRAVTLLLER